MKKILNVGKFALSCLLLLTSISFAQDASVNDLYNAVYQEVGAGDYVYFDHAGVDGELGFRTKSWGTNGNLADSSRATWTDNQEFVETLTGLTSSISYDVYIVTGGKISSTWGVRAGFESGVYALETVTLAVDSAVEQYNLGLYYNEEDSFYPFREEQDYSDRACMYVAYVGKAMTNASGSLTVYVNDAEFTLNGITGDRTWYDGILVKPTAEPYSPSPADGLYELEPADTVLTWVPGNDPNGVVSEDFYVYLGTTSETLECVNPSSPISETSFAIGMTEYNSTYYWQIEEAIADSEGFLYPAGEPNNITGPVWSFATVYYVPRMIDITDEAYFRGGTSASITATYDSSKASVESVTWYLNDVAIDVESNPNYSVTYSDTETTLTIVASEATYGAYSCIVVNSYGSSDPSKYSVISSWPLWTWTGSAGSSLWSVDGNWDAGTAPTKNDDVLINGEAAVDMDLSGDFAYKGYITLAGDAQLTSPEGIRFAGGNGSSTVTTIQDNAKLMVGPSNYTIISKSRSSVVNQAGGEFNTQVSRGFFFTDTSGISGEYNLTGGTLTVDFTNDSAYQDFWFRMMGRDSSEETDLFHIDGGDAFFNNNGDSGRRIYIMRDSEMIVDSGSANFTNIQKVSIGREVTGVATVTLNGGELNFNDTDVYVGDLAVGQLDINGGVFTTSQTDGTGIGLRCGYGDTGYGYVNQNAGVADLGGMEIALGSPSSIVTKGEYTISGGSLKNVAALNMYANSKFTVSGSAADEIDIQQLSVEDSSAVLSFELDQDGCSMITVGATANDPNGYNSGAKLDNLTITVDTLESFVGIEGQNFNIMLVKNNGVTGFETVNFVSNSDQDFDLKLVDATSFGYPSGKLLQVSVAFDPERADFNLDGIVDLIDFSMFTRAWLWEKDEESVE